jgi:two-component system CheB/CheR fusion protein
VIGTGYSSLAYLRRYPIAMIKIDRSFIDDQPIVAAIAGMARALGMLTVPEGVETEEQLQRMLALECDYVQGYHLGHPQAARELEAQLASTR